ncbi:MAG: hypothetical protein KDA37_12790, partial [Planctomycetales bacterium]|nr:hypothetical protein [Planctomycetales bacterium]
DYTVWRDTLGSTNALAADGDDSGTVDPADYELWRDNYASEDAVLAQVATPEPATVVLLVGVLWFVHRMRG